ncbi:MAG: hypothetical protein ACUVT9_05375 [Candidatus Bathycorpusculaceae bacterium]
MDTENTVNILQNVTAKGKALEDYINGHRVNVSGISIRVTRGGVKKQDAV